MMNPVSWLQMTNMISYQELVRTFPNIEGRNVQINAIHAAKVKLTAMGISCGTNTIEKEWTHFVATAWGVTPSQVVSAAKALKRRESQEQK
jgi:hypothetical protein